ncbi:MAG: PTS lactose/cellobiose transporter subunit IIA [Oscillospiraceae bacterium]|nr:PTS lactose/cellobiose transporter subunit IIA [Oscillospiraceae bacterium]
MDSIQECMKMTSLGGEAKSLSLAAIKAAREGRFEEADEKLKAAKEALIKSHEAHTQLLRYDAENDDLRVTIFMVHAADHLNSAETIKALAEEFILLYKEIKHV